MKFQLLGKKLLIEVEKEDVAKSAGGIYMTAETVSIKDKNIGVITQLGNECVREVISLSGEKRKFKVGDRVAFLAHQGTTFNLEGEKLVVFDEDFIFAMIYE